VEDHEDRSDTQMDRYFMNIFKLGESICIQLVERLSELIQHDVVGSIIG
jgi:hypothetical protein